MVNNLTFASLHTGNTWSRVVNSRVVCSAISNQSRSSFLIHVWLILWALSHSFRFVLDRLIVWRNLWLFPYHRTVGDSAQSFTFPLAGTGLPMQRGIKRIASKGFSGKLLEVFVNVKGTFQAPNGGWIMRKETTNAWKKASTWTR